MEKKWLKTLLAMFVIAALATGCAGGGQGTEVQGTEVIGDTGGGEGSAGAAEGPFTIGVSNGFVGSEWRTQMIENMQQLNQAYMDAGLTEELVIESADVDVQGQIQQISNLINRGVDAIIINPNNQTALNPVIQTAVDAGIIVIAVDQEVSAPGAINVVIDQTEWARMSARWLAEELGGQGNVVVVNGISGHPANEARYQGVQEVFAEYPDIQIVNEVNANWDQTTAQQRMADILAGNPDIDGIWVQDGMAEGVLRAMMASNIQDWPVMVGEARAGYIQLANEVMQERDDFPVYGVVNPPGVGADGMKVAIELLRGNELVDGALTGPFNNSLYVPIPGEVNQENFAERFSEVEDRPASYVLDGIVTDEELSEFFTEPVQAVEMAR